MPCLCLLIFVFEALSEFAVCGRLRKELKEEGEVDELMIQR